MVKCSSLLLVLWAFHDDVVQTLWGIAIDNGTCNYPRGHVLGGSSTINYMMYVRGNREDFDEWARLGNSQWSYDNVLPYFKKSENCSSMPEYRDSPYRGTSGPLHVQRTLYRSSLADEFMKAGQEFGLKHLDYNGESQIGMDYVQVTMKGRSRASSAASYLNPVRDRPNLSISIRSFVTKILLNPATKTAIGVEFIKDNKTIKVYASKEVVVSCGAISSPKLLMLSGIGPMEHLQSLGIPVVSDLPVGDNLQDHLCTALGINLNSSIAYSLDSQHDEMIYDYSVMGKGPLTGLGLESQVFISTVNSSTIPDIQWALGTEPGSVTMGFDSAYKSVTAIYLARPFSKGKIRLRSVDPFEQPLIDTNYLSDMRDHDTFKKGIQMYLKYLKTPTMRKYGITLRPITHKLCMKYVPDNSIEHLEENDDFLNCLIRNYGRSNFHIVGTTKMGPDNDKEAVTNSDLQVRGIKNLRVIDGSIMPTIVRGNTNAPIIMIGEKGADIIKKYHKQIR